MGLFTSFSKWFLPERRPISHVDSATLEELLKAAENSLPNEFLALLVAEDSSKLSFKTEDLENVKVITGFHIIPATNVTRKSASIKTQSVPTTETIVGSFHSHPSGVLKPSQKDKQMFQKYPINIIAGPPFETTSWVCFDNKATQRDLAKITVQNNTISDEWTQELSNLHID